MAAQVIALKEFKEELIEIYAEEHIDGLMAEFDVQQGRVWSKSLSDLHLEEESILVSLFLDNTLIHGSQILTISDSLPNWQYYILEDQSKVRVLHTSFALDNRYHVTLLQPLLHEYQFAISWLNRAFGWFGAISFMVLLVLFAIIQCRRDHSVKSIQKLLTSIAKKPDSTRVKLDKPAAEFVPLISSINQMLDDVTTVHTTIKTMSEGIAHDLKTPLTRVANRLQTMRHSIDSPELLRTHLDHASTDLNSTITTFNNLVRLSAIESGQHKKDFITLDLSSLTLDLAQSFEPVFSDSGRTLEVSVIEGVQCLGNADLISQLICNLLENALEYSNANAKVWLRLQSHTTGALLQIGDNGPGIAPDDQARIFDKFFRADKSRTKPGNGLGLSIVKAICTIHQAKVYLLKDQNGAVFNVEIPHI
ncbi:hypothetical protein PA25_21260 [Pseudoalteromonas sp. A25]|nr:hypothetical protein PA25_21260 [Pseudoalteromonas sp. A25]